MFDFDDFDDDDFFTAIWYYARSQGKETAVGRWRNREHSPQAGLSPGRPQIRRGNQNGRLNRRK